MGMEENTGEDISALCYGPGSIAGAVIGTFLTTILLLAVFTLLYKQWRKRKGNHLVLVTDPEIVEDAYAFDNPCFKDATPAPPGRNIERPLSVVSVETPTKDSTRWSSPWSSLGLGSGFKSDKRRTLDDSCLGSNATRVSVVSLRSRDFTGLGFNVCGNMREGIFVKDLLHRGPASESGRIHPGDRIASVKISFRTMVYEDALTILSYASPYDVEIEVESGGGGSRPTTLLKKTVGPSPARICHPLYRSQSIPELSRSHKSSAKRLFIADPNESPSSNYSTLNSTLKSCKSTSGTHTLERQNEESKGNNNYHRFGIKVLPALDGTVHRIENQNEHNTNLERRNSRKLDVVKNQVNNNTKDVAVIEMAKVNGDRVTVERLRQRENPIQSMTQNGTDATDSRWNEVIQKTNVEVVIPSEVPAEVHNAAMAARRNRKNSAELLKSPKCTTPESPDLEDKKSPQKNKRKAPAPPASLINESNTMLTEQDTSLPLNKYERETVDDKIETIADYTQSLKDYVDKVHEIIDDSEARQHRLNERSSLDRRNSESDTDNEMQNSFTTIELNPADITIHHTPVPRMSDDDVDDDDDNADDVYRKAASLGDLSKYEAKGLATLERAQSLDMADTGSRKRKAPLPPDDITESSELLTTHDGIGTFDRTKLKKSSEWGTLEDAIWNKNELDNSFDPETKTRKKSNGTLERSKSSVEIKLKQDTSSHAANINPNEDSIELYNLPLSKQLTKDFIHAERMFNPDEDNSLARIINDGEIVKSPTVSEIELDFREAKPLADNDEESIKNTPSPVVSESFGRALRLFDLHTNKSSIKTGEFKNNFDGILNGDDSLTYVGLKEVDEKPMKKIKVITSCPYCDQGGHHDKNCKLHGLTVNGDKNTLHGIIRDSRSPDENYLQDIEKQIENVSNVKSRISTMENGDEEDIDDEYSLGSSVTINSKTLSSPNGNHHNVSNVSVSSGDNSEDSGLVGESGEYNQKEIDVRPPLPNTPIPIDESPRKMTYITEIKVSPSREIVRDIDEVENNRDRIKPLRSEVTVTSNGKSTTGKKPPVPPRRGDASKSLKESSHDKQVVYVSEYKSSDNNGRIESPDKLDNRQLKNKKIDHWTLLSENKDQNPWGNGSNQPQSVTNIVVASGDEKTYYK
ncbi:hypothetical protein PV327_002418 [Microctonus hyperodae]|uniref:PDZ domain-containing protein n=1 Tax=Microctonus hyperodae TaxID=165561 RepID=A0AA39KP33_MICHY|nr:hypothetical protein PV327_002418 [Microctonus hyperodae]